MATRRIIFGITVLAIVADVLIALFDLLSLGIGWVTVVDAISVILLSGFLLEVQIPERWWE